MKLLQLRAVEIRNHDTWRWLLTDSNGVALVDQQVALKPTSAEYKGFVDLLGYLRWNAVPDRRPESKAALLSQLGDWLGSNLFGAVGPAIAEQAPAVVRVLLPEELEFLLHRPLALAQVNGVPLAEQTSLVFDTTGDSRQVPKNPVGDRLRMLAVFSLPTETSAVPQRLERHELTRVIDRLGAVARAPQLRVLQYGVRREWMESVLEEGASWDVVHLSGHGIAVGDGLILEKPDGSPDVLTADELVRLLRRCRSQLKLVVISHNQSLAADLAERRHRAGFEELPNQGPDDADQAGPTEFTGTDEQPPGAPLSELAAKLASRLGCAVVAMRYPWAEDTTAHFNSSFYENLFRQGHDVTAALCRALAAVARADPSARLIAAASPILVGRLAVDLNLKPPVLERPELGSRIAALAGFPAEPDRFVGRNGTMARASKALAPASGLSGIVLHGLVGAGKTACALELAHGHADVFQRLVWWRAPEEASSEAAAALSNLGAALERQLGGFSFLPLLDDPAAYRHLLLNLAALLDGFPLLVILDGLDSLLTADGQWRDPRWEALIEAMTARRGRARVILTCRTPLVFRHQQTLVLPVPTLPLDEAIMLAQELPHLRALMHADPGPARDERAAVVSTDRALLRRALKFVQGHPTMIELADSIAADPALLAANLEAAERQGSPSPLFTSAPGHPEAAAFLASLANWSASAVAALPDPSRLLLQLLCSLEEPDRTTAVIGRNWEDFWRRVDQAGDPPLMESALEPLTSLTLAAAERTVSPFGPSTLLRINPAVTERVRAITGEGVRGAVDKEMADFWVGVFDAVRIRTGPEAGRAAICAGQAAAPYLNRCEDWERLRSLLQQVLSRDSSPRVVQAVLPFLQHVAETTGRPYDLGLLGTALISIEPAAAEQLLRQALDLALDERDFLTAYSIAGVMASMLRNKGRLGEALAVTDDMAGLARQADLGPWTQLVSQARRLEIMALLGQNENTLIELRPLMARMDQLPGTAGPDEAVQPWNVRETALNAGRTATIALGRWEEALDLDAQILDSLTRRGASRHEIASARLNGYGPLLRLGRLAEAERLLLDCQASFEAYGDIPGIARVLTARAGLEHQRGDAALAADLQRTALRLFYTLLDPRDIAGSHFNLAAYLAVIGADTADSLAHLLSAALIYQLIGMTDALQRALTRLAAGIRPPTGTPPQASTVSKLAAQVGKVDGVRLGLLVATLCPNPNVADQVLADVIQQARELPDETSEVRSHLEEWEPRIAALVAAVGGEEVAAAAINRSLDQIADDKNWSALVHVLRRILAGDRDREQLTAGLDAIGTAIVERALDAITGRIQLTISSAILQQWQPIISAVAVAAVGKQELSEDLNRLLDQLADTSDWGTVVTVLRRILAGERNPDQLTVGLDALDEIDTAIVGQVLARLAAPQGDQLDIWASLGMGSESESPLTW